MIFVCHFFFFKQKTASEWRISDWSSDVCSSDLKSGGPVIVLRGGASPRASAAHSRWTVRPAPSVPLMANAPGLPACEVELSRRRGGPSGMRWRLEWEEGEGAGANGGFHAKRIETAPLSGAVVPMVPMRAGEEDGGGAVVRAFGTDGQDGQCPAAAGGDRKSTRLNSSH